MIVGHIEMDNFYDNLNHLFSLYWSEDTQINDTLKFTPDVDTFQENSIQQTCLSPSKISNSNYITNDHNGNESF
jgi:hypothetical protein